jgi:Flp pilus assembly protein CpaB
LFLLYNDITNPSYKEYPMRRGRIFIYLALIIIVGVAGAALYYWRSRPVISKSPVGTQVPQVRYVEIITAGQNIYPGTVITDAMLSSLQIPEDKLVQGLFTKKADLVSKYAKYAIAQGVPITDSMVSTSPGNVNLPGSSWAPLIPQGLTAVSIPVTRLSSTAFGIRDGDYVDVIVTMLLVDVDPAMQTVLPNNIAGLEDNPNSPSGLLKITQGDVTQGHFEVDEVSTDPVSNILLYVQPSEKQRGRLVTQMIMQNIQVLHTGTFALPGELPAEQVNVGGAGVPTATPVPANQPQATPVIVRPDIITVMVTPQDAVTLTYLIFSGAQINLTLRNPNDQTPISQPDAAMLEYLLTQYNIPVPAKLPYSLQPRLDALQQPVMPNDATPVP